MELDERFWEKVDKSAGDDACWLWTGNTYPHGYGLFYLRSKNVYAHRMAWTLTNGLIPDGLLVCHHCDVRHCVNPAHLFLGTHADNTHDMIAKGREARKERNGVHTHPGKRATGERNGSKMHPELVPHSDTHCVAKLNSEKVQRIREQYASGGVALNTLAAEYGVHRGTIWYAIKCKTWRHVS